MKKSRRAKITLSVFLALFSFVALFYSIGLFKLVTIVILMASIAYLVRKLFVDLNDSNRAFRVVISSQLTPERKFVRDLLIGIVLFGIGFIVLQTPLVIVLALVDLIVITRELFEQRRKRREKHF